MPNPKATVSQAELRRCFRALREAGFDEGRVEIERADGTTVRIVAGKASEAADTGVDIDRMIEKLP